MIQDKYLPVFDFNEVHRVMIKCPANRVKVLVDDLDFGGSWVIRTLFFLRGMSSRMLTWRGLEHAGFTRLETTEDEMIIGLIGQFWRPSGNLQSFRPEEFSSFNKMGFQKAVWSFRLIPHNSDCSLETETRIQCIGEDARRRFRVYWTVVKPFSGLIRMELLRGIRRSAERAWHRNLKS